MKSIESLKKSNEILEELDKEIDATEFKQEFKMAFKSLIHENQRLLDELEGHYEPMYKVSPDLLERLDEKGVELVNYLVSTGFYSSKDTYLIGVQRAIMKLCQTVKFMDLEMNVVKQCINSVIKTGQKEGNENKYQSLLDKLTSL